MAARLSIDKVHLSGADDPDEEWFELRNSGDLPYVARGCTLAINGPEGRSRRLRLRDPFTVPPYGRLRVVSGKARGEKRHATHYLFEKRTLLAAGDTLRLMHRQREICHGKALLTTKRQWIKHRPRVGLRVLWGAMAGERLMLEVVVHAKHAVPIEAITACFRGEQRVAVSSTGGRPPRRALPEHRAVLEAARTLPAGEHLFRLAFRLPSSLPPTFSSTRVDVRYELEVRVEIPWWPDRRAVFEVPLAFPKGQREPRPLVTVSDADGPPPREAYAELSLASTTLVPGGLLEGAVALYNVGQVAYKAVRLRVQRVVTVKDGRRQATEIHPLLYDTPLPAKLEEGEPLPFRCVLPKELRPTFSSTPHKGVSWVLDWRLEVEVVVGWGRNLRLAVPLAVVNDEAPSTRERVPAVGIARTEALWTELAARYDLHHADDRLSKEAKGWSLVVHRELRHGERLLIAELLPSEPLGLGLLVEPALLGRFSGLSLGLADFDAAHRVYGHDQAQLAHLLVPWVRQWPLCMRLEASDHGLRVLTPGAGYQRESLEALVRVGLAGLREVPARCADLPLPAVLASSEPFWRELAAHVEQSALDFGAPRLYGQWAGRALRVEALWQQAEVVGIGLALASTLSSRVCRPQPLRAADVAGLSELSARSRQIVARLLSGEQRLLLEPRGATLLIYDCEAFSDQASTASERVAQVVLQPLAELSALLDDLAGRGGPYR